MAETTSIPFDLMSLILMKKIKRDANSLRIQRNLDQDAVVNLF